MNWLLARKRQGVISVKKFECIVVLIGIVLVAAGCGQEKTAKNTKTSGVEVESYRTGSEQQGPIATSLTEKREASRAKMPSGAKSSFSKFTEQLKQSHILDKALKEGDTIPAFTLTNAVGEEVSSVSLLARGPLVLVFYRGGW